mmetsp:Transcript_5928/g.13045  ORF Transcript_5928/g.13045 Transcript_5928/m.13045 type:complete len:487 (+) Transcript_5928:54-1514(+)
MGAAVGPLCCPSCTDFPKGDAAEHGLEQVVTTHQLSTLDDADNEGFARDDKIRAGLHRSSASSPVPISSLSRSSPSSALGRPSAGVAAWHPVNSSPARGLDWDVSSSPVVDVPPRAMSNDAAIAREPNSTSIMEQLSERDVDVAHAQTARAGAWVELDIAAPRASTLAGRETRHQQKSRLATRSEMVCHAEQGPKSLSKASEGQPQPIIEVHTAPPQGCTPPRQAELARVGRGTIASAASEPDSEPRPGTPGGTPGSCQATGSSHPGTGALLLNPPTAVQPRSRSRPTPKLQPREVHPASHYGLRAQAGTRARQGPQTLRLFVPLPVHCEAKVIEYLNFNEQRILRRVAKCAEEALGWRTFFDPPPAPRTQSRTLSAPPAAKSSSRTLAEEIQETRLDINWHSASSSARARQQPPASPERPAGRPGLGRPRALASHSVPARPERGAIPVQPAARPRLAPEERIDHALPAAVLTITGPTQVRVPSRS